MLTFPLVRNELLRQGRRAETYWARVGMIALVLMPLLVIAWTGWYYGADLEIQPEQLGMGLSFAAALLQFIAAFFVAPTFAANALTQEKDERTLGLLIMADLSGWGIILSKWTSVMLRVGTLMLCTAPFIGFAALFGAVDVRAALTLAAILLVCSGSVAAVGLYFSTVLRYSNMANTFALLSVLVAAYIFGYVDFELYPGGTMVNPLTKFTLAVFVGIYPGGYEAALAEAAIGCAIVVLLGALFLVAAVSALPRQVHESVKRPGFLRGGFRRSSIGFWRQDPLARLVRASVGSITMAGRNIFIRVLAFMGLGVILLVPIVGCYMVMVVLFREILLSMERLRNSGALDDLVLVPHTDAELGRAFWWGYVSASGIYGALIAASLVLMWFSSDLQNAFLYVALPLAAVQFLAAVGLACASGTFRRQFGGALGAYAFLFLVVLGYTAPFAAYVWLRRQQWSVVSWIDLVFETRWDAIGDRIGWNVGLIVFVAFNVLLFAAVTAFSCFVLGRRLRKRPVFERLPAPKSAASPGALEA